MAYVEASSVTFSFLFTSSNVGLRWTGIDVSGNLIDDPRLGPDPGDTAETTFTYSTPCYGMYFDIFYDGTTLDPEMMAVTSVTATVGGVERSAVLTSRTVAEMTDDPPILRYVGPGFNPPALYAAGGLEPGWPYDDQNPTAYDADIVAACPTVFSGDPRTTLVLTGAPYDLDPVYVAAQSWAMPESGTHPLGPITFAFTDLPDPPAPTPGGRRPHLRQRQRWT